MSSQEHHHQEQVRSPVITHDPTMSQPHTGPNNQAMIDEIMELKAKISSIIATIRDSKTVCSKYENEIQYLQEYIGTLMQSEDLKTKN